MILYLYCYGVTYITHSCIYIYIYIYIYICTYMLCTYVLNITLFFQSGINKKLLIWFTTVCKKRFYNFTHLLRFYSFRKLNISVLLFDVAHKQCFGIIKGWLHYLTPESKGRFLMNNILLDSAHCLVMAQIHFSLIKKIKIGRLRHSSTPPPPTSYVLQPPSPPASHFCFTMIQLNYFFWKLLYLLVDLL